MLARARFRQLAVRELDDPFGRLLGAAHRLGEDDVFHSIELIADELGIDRAEPATARWTYRSNSFAARRRIRFAVGRA
jgi:hypothetical protein